MVAILDQFERPFPNAAQRRAAAVRARYDAAVTNTDNERHWLAADQLSPVAAASPSVRKVLRERCRYECHGNNCFGYGIVRAIANDVIGTGPRLQVLTRNEEANAVIEKRFARWARTVRLAAMLRTARVAKAVDGETIILQTTNYRQQNPVKLYPRNIECDHLHNPETSLIDDNADDGKFLDPKDHQARFYRILRKHPGSFDPIGQQEWDDLDAADVIHWYRQDRPGQQRGIPEITPALPLFAQLRRFTLAVLAAAETAADIAGVIKSQTLPEEQVSNIREMEAIPIEPRALLTLPRGWDAEAFRAEQPATTYQMFRDAILNEIARCVLMPMNLATGNSAKYNFASGRLDHKAWEKLVAIEREETAIEVLDPILGWWLEEAVFYDDYLPPGLPPFNELPYRWLWDQVDYVDPSKERAYVEGMMKLGLICDDDWLMEHKTDPKEHWEKVERSINRRRQLGMPQPWEVGMSQPDDTEPDDDEKQQEADESGDANAHADREFANAA